MGFLYRSLNVTKFNSTHQTPGASREITWFLMCKQLIVLITKAKRKQVLRYYTIDRLYSL